MLYLNTPSSSISNLVLYPRSAFGKEIIFVLGSIQFNSVINGQLIPTRYYPRNSKIDERNHTRQDDLQFDRELQTKYWNIRVNTEILGMNDVDTYSFDNACKWWDKEGHEENSMTTYRISWLYKKHCSSLYPH